MQAKLWLRITKRYPSQVWRDEWVPQFPGPRNVLYWSNSRHCCSKHTSVQRTKWVQSHPNPINNRTKMKPNVVFKIAYRKYVHPISYIFFFFLVIWMVLRNFDGVSKNKDIPITSRGSLYGCEMLKIPHCLDNRLTVNCEILVICSSTYSPVRTSQEAHSVSIK
jgi:hypothetical protein